MCDPRAEKGETAVERTISIFHFRTSNLFDNQSMCERDVCANVRVSYGHINMNINAMPLATCSVRTIFINFFNAYSVTFSFIAQYELCESIKRPILHGANTSASCCLCLVAKKIVAKVTA